MSVNFSEIIKATEGLKTTVQNFFESDLSVRVVCWVEQKDFCDSTTDEEAEVFRNHLKDAGVEFEDIKDLPSQNKVRFEVSERSNIIIEYKPGLIQKRNDLLKKMESISQELSDIDEKMIQ